MIMAKSSNKIKVMISSRCKDRFPFNDANSPLLTDIRKDLKKEIEETKIFGKELFEVWISEDEAPQEGISDSWEFCLKQVEKCDILLVLFNGSAGRVSEGVGICHAELMTGLDKAPGKVRVISLDNSHINKDEQTIGDQRFQDYVKKQDLFYGSTVKDIEELKLQTKSALYDALTELAHKGVREASKGRFHSGEALDWARMDFRRRQESMTKILYNSINEKSTDPRESSDYLFVKLGDTDILFEPHAIPDALSIGAAKEMVGQPFLHDQKMAHILTENRGGPVHIIACHKNATEFQAKKLLGFPDATVVSAPFGIYVADNVQKVQFAFIVNCRDETTTRYGVQRFFEWLEQTGEDKLMAKRAKSRAKIVRAIAKEVDK